MVLNTQELLHDRMARHFGVVVNVLFMSYKWLRYRYLKCIGLLNGLRIVRPSRNVFSIKDVCQMQTGSVQF
jgi:hypothetical protein